MQKSANETSGPVFVVGVNGSGTTMMLDHLGHHPSLFGFRLETYVLPHYLANEASYGDLNEDANFRRLWEDMSSEYAFRRMNRGRPLSLPEDWDSGERGAAQVFDKIMRQFARLEDKRRWCEKTPSYAAHIEAIARAFPSASFIHMIRDGRDCAASNYRRWRRHPEGTIYRWKLIIREARKQKAAARGRYMELRYEDLTSDPERHMRDVCDFLGVVFDERVLMSRRARRHMAGVSSRTIVSVNKSRLEFRSSRLVRLEEFAGRQLAELGYDVHIADGDSAPTKTRRLWWLVHDFFAVATRQIRRKITVQKRMTWSLVFSRWRAIVRQIKQLPPE